MNDTGSCDFIAGIATRKEALNLRLAAVMASSVPLRVKVARVQQITQEILALKDEVAAAMKRNSDE